MRVQFSSVPYILLSLFFFRDFIIVLFFLSLSFLLLQKMKEFRHKVGNWLPAIRKNDPLQGRTEFSGINDLLQYIIDVDKEQKQRAKTVTPTSTATTEIETPVGSNKWSCIGCLSRWGTHGQGNDPSIVIQIIQKYDDKLIIFLFSSYCRECHYFVCDYNVIMTELVCLNMLIVVLAK